MKTSFRSILPCIFLTGLVVASSCVFGSDLRETLRIEREVVLSPGHSVSPNVIVRTPDGGYIVAGGDNEENTEAWVTRLDRNGRTQWEYLDGPADSWVSTDTHSGFSRTSVPAAD
jgi:hypothetical protein